jgi:hypothetical protein
LDKNRFSSLTLAMSFCLCGEENAQDCLFAPKPEESYLVFGSFPSISPQKYGFKDKSLTSWEIIYA